jgi:predicted ABC-type sugar transport system permease subunit
VLVGIVVVVWLIMRYTMLGRNIYAVGGDEMSASRAGINVRFTKILHICVCGHNFRYRRHGAHNYDGQLQPCRPYGK